MKATWRELSDGAVVPERLSEGERMWLRVLGPNAFCVLLELHYEVARRGRTEVNFFDVAQRLGMNETNVWTAVNLLVARGVIFKEGEGNLLIIPIAFPMPTEKDADRMRSRRHQAKERGDNQP